MTRTVDYTTTVGRSPTSEGLRIADQFQAYVNSTPARLFLARGVTITGAFGQDGTSTPFSGGSDRALLFIRDARGHALGSIQVLPSPGQQGGPETASVTVSYTGNLGSNIPGFDLVMRVFMERFVGQLPQQCVREDRRAFEVEQQKAPRVID